MYQRQYNFARSCVGSYLPCLVDQYTVDAYNTSSNATEKTCLTRSLFWTAINLLQPIVKDNFQSTQDCITYLSHLSVTRPLIGSCNWWLFFWMRSFSNRCLSNDNSSNVKNVKSGSFKIGYIGLILNNIK